jgi:predicted membrane metal-binding protein
MVENLAVTLSAIAATLPIIALNFQRVSLVAPLANLLALPAFPPMLLLSALDAVAGALWSPLGEIGAWAAWPLLAYLAAVAGRLADLPLAALEAPDFGMGHAVLCTPASVCWLVAQPADPVGRWSLAPSAWRRVRCGTPRRLLGSCPLPGWRGAWP